MKKLEKLSALMNKEAKGITTEEIAEVNAELSANGFEVEVATVGTIEQLNAQIATLTTERDTAQADLATRTEELATVTQERDTLAKGPAAEATVIKAEKDKLETNSEVPPHKKALDETLAKYGL